MSFYQAMQLGANNLKPLIKDTEDKKLKKKYMTALVLKNILCLLFCMIVVTSFGKIFGNENSVVGVVTVIALLTYRLSNLDFDVKQSTFTIFGIFCIFMVGPYLASISSVVGVVTVIALLTYRLSNLDFDVKQSTFTIFGIFCIFMVGPYLASISIPVLRFIINFVSIMAIVILSCYNVNLSNQSIFVLSYLLLYGYQINDVAVYVNRVFALLVGGTIVSVIFYIKQRNTKFENTFSDIIKGVNLNNERTKWQLKFTLGVCSAMLIGDFLNLEKTMWVGFACMSILQPTQEKIDFRLKNRFPFMIVGCIVYFILCLVVPMEYRSFIGILGGIMVGFSATYQWQTVFNCFGALTSAVPVLGLEGVVPMEYRSFIGILGGIMVGFSATYQWQTVFNCFGALTSAVPVLGLEGAIILRILNNAFGAIYSKVFSYAFDKVDEKIAIRNNSEEIASQGEI